MAVVPDRRLALSQKLNILESNECNLKEALLQLSKMVSKCDNFINNSLKEETNNKDFQNEGSFFYRNLICSVNTFFIIKFFFQLIICLKRTKVFRMKILQSRH